MFTRRSSGEKLVGYWEFPGGKVEEGETPQESLARQLQEELGIQAVIGEIRREFAPVRSWEFRIVAYEADWIAGDLRARVHDRVEWVKIGDIGDYQLLPADVPVAASTLDIRDHFVTVRPW